MSERLQLPTAMWRVQYTLLGGHRRMLAVVIVSATVLLMGILGLRRILSDTPFPGVGKMICVGLSVIQCLVIVMGGCNAIYRAMLRDYDSKMIESHRLTPMSNLTVPLGYLFGSTLQVTTMFLLIVGAGAIVSDVASLSVADWLIGNFFMYTGAVTMWSAAVFLGLRQTKPFNAVPVALGIAMLSAAIAPVPAAGLLLNVYPILLGMFILTSAYNIPNEAVVGITVVNIIFGLYWLFAAAVKYRRPDLPALTTIRGLFLVFMVVALGTLGIMAYENITTTTKSLHEFYSGDVLRNQWIVTLLGSILLAAVPVAGVAKCRVLAARGAKMRSRGDLVAPIVVAILATAIICVVMSLLGSRLVQRILPEPTIPTGFAATLQNSWLLTGATCLLALITLCRVFEIGYAMMKSPKLLVTLLLMLGWAAPPFVDGIRTVYVEEATGRPAEISWLFGCSPGGTIYAAWSDESIVVWPGMLVQLCLAVILTIVARYARRSMKRVAERTEGTNPAPSALQDDGRGQ